MVSPANMQQFGGYGHVNNMVSPEFMQNGYGHGYSYSNDFVSQENMQPEFGQGYGYSAAGFPPYPSYPPYPAWPQTAGVSANANKSDCGCKGNRSEPSTAKQVEVETPKAVKTAVPRKNTKKAVIRTVTSRPSKTKNRNNQPWINR